VAKKTINIIVGVLVTTIMLAVLAGCQATSTSTSSTTTSSTTTKITTTNPTTPAATTTAVTTTAATTTAATTATTSATAAYTIPTVPASTTTYKFDRTFQYYAVLPLSGSSASLGINEQRGLNYAISEINAEGGIVVNGSRYKVACQYFDDAFDGTKAVTIAQQIILQNNAKFVANLGTAMLVATEDTYAQSNVLVMASTIGQPKVISTKWPLQFMNGLDPADHGTSVYYPYFAGALGVKTIAVANPNADNGHIFSDIIKSVVKTQGIPVTLVSDEFYTPGTQDYTPLIAKLMALKPDMIDLSGAAPGEIALFAKQARDAGYKGIVADMTSQADPALAWQVAGAASTGVYTIGFAGADPTADYTTFRQYVEKQINETMYVSVPYNYEQELMFFRSISVANSFDPYKVASVLQDMTWTGLYGPCKFYGDEPGNPVGIKRLISVNQPLIQFTTNGNANVIYRGTWPNGTTTLNGK